MGFDKVLSDHDLIKGIKSKAKVGGLTHNFYKYPARFAPEFVRAIVMEFTKPGAIVVDPFMGGGTSLIESSSLGRQAVGADISSLATFISKVKTTPLSLDELKTLESWIETLQIKLNLRNKVIRPMKWINRGYLKNLNTKNIWPIRKSIGLAISAINELSTSNLQNFARCALLKTSQWALDNRTSIPAVEGFRNKLSLTLSEMSLAIKDYESSVRRSFYEHGDCKPFFPLSINARAQEISDEYAKLDLQPPDLIITSPPYPGVHILYHRWQIHGRKETPAPFWISNMSDGKGCAFYTFGDRSSHRGGRYYLDLKESFESIARIANKRTLWVQMIGFTELDPDLESYLRIMKEVGLEECKIQKLSDGADGRIWRNVPNRKWYTRRDGHVGTWKEVVLFHRLRK